MTRAAFGRSLEVLGFVAAAGLIILIVVVPRLTGGAALTVLTGSMSPTYPVGSLVLVVPTDPLTIQPGDVITFQTAPGVAEYVTHRVVRVQPDTQPYSFITKGDANRGEDLSPVPVGAVRGTVRFHVPYLGSVSTLVRTPVGLLVLAFIPAVWFISGQVRVIREELRGRLARRPEPIAPVPVVPTPPDPRTPQTAAPVPTPPMALIGHPTAAWSPPLPWHRATPGSPSTPCPPSGWASSSIDWRPPSAHQGGPQPTTPAAPLPAPAAGSEVPAA